MLNKRIYKRTNPYSKQSEMLTNEEAIVYDIVKQSEEMQEYNKMQKGLDKFSRLNPKAYMTLLDWVTTIGCGANAPQPLATWYFIEVPSSFLKKSSWYKVKPFKQKGVPLLSALFLDLDGYPG